MSRLSTKYCSIPAYPLRPLKFFSPKPFGFSQMCRDLRLQSTVCVPDDAWDSHIHVTDTENFPISKRAKYHPHSATLPSALANADQLKLPNLVFVQPSTYGSDNSCLLDALKEVGPNRGRGVVVLDRAGVDEDTLRQWHDLGVRGIRLNLISTTQTHPRGEKLRQLIRAHADAVKMMKTWVLQLYMGLPFMEDIEPLLPDLGVKLVFDHYGSPSLSMVQAAQTAGPSSMPGWDSLIRMLGTSLAYVKISAPYRLSSDPEFSNLEAMTRLLLSVNNGEAVVFASDWPHTRFEGADVKPFLHKCLEWCDGDQDLADKLFRDNARRLWDVRLG